MNKLKRRPFFIKGNFQLVFIIGFVLLLLLEVILAGLFIYGLSKQAIERQEFSSHITTSRSAVFISPIIIKVNICIALLSLVLASLLVLFTHLRLHKLFSKIIQGLENLKNANTSFHIKPYGNKSSRQIIAEYNLIASYFAQHLNEINLTLAHLLETKDLKELANLHKKLSSLI